MKIVNTEKQTSTTNSFRCAENQIILFEKRKRYQKYSALNYCAELVTFFDFLSLDAFNIIKTASYLAQSSNDNVITDLHILLSFLEKGGEFRRILEDSGILKADIVKSFQPIKKNYLPSIVVQLVSKVKLFFSKESLHNNNSIIFSEETSSLLEKVAENALFQFKTPIITSEILFLTLVEQKKTSIFTHLKKISSQKVLWYSFRYRLLKRIHFIESCIRNNVPKNQHYFAYLLQTQIPESHFDRLINNNMLGIGALFFRTKLISKIKRFSLLSIIEKEIYNSIKFLNPRKYSS